MTRKLLRRGVYSAFGICFLGSMIYLGAVIYWATQSLPIAPEGVRCYTNTLRTRLTPPNERLEWEAGFKVAQFAELKSGEIIAPVLYVGRPKFRGFMGGVSYESDWEATYQSMGVRYPELIIPVGNDIQRHIVIIRRLAADDAPGPNPWRIWEFTPPAENDDLVVPAFDRLMLFSTRKDADELLQRDRTARVFADKLRK